MIFEEDIELMKARKFLSLILITGLIFVFVTSCDDEFEEPGISHIDWDNHDLRAERFVIALVNGDFTIAAEGFDEEMSRVLGVRGLRKAWRDTARIAGDFKSIYETELIPHDEYEIYHVVSWHANRYINTRIVFSFDGKIAGLFFSFL